MLPAVWSVGVGSPPFWCTPADGATFGLVGGSGGVGAAALGTVVAAGGAAIATGGAAGATCGTNFAAGGAAGATRGTNFAARGADAGDAADAAGGADAAGATRGTDFAAVGASGTRGTDFAAVGADAARATRGTDFAAGGVSAATCGAAAATCGAAAATCGAAAATCGAAAATLGRVGDGRGDGGTFLWAAFHPDAGTAGGLHAFGAALGAVSARGATFPEGHEEPATSASPGGWPEPTLRGAVALRVSNQRASNKITTTPATIDISMSPLAREPFARLANA
jgi:hypothetical protein